MKTVMGMTGTRGNGEKGAKGLGQRGLREEGFKGSEGKTGTERSLGIVGDRVTMGMGETGVEGIRGLGQPALRAIPSGHQLAFALQRECYSIPVLHVREEAWLVDITPVPQMPGYPQRVVRLPERTEQLDLQLTSGQPERNSGPTAGSNLPPGSE
jgi:hypothetical protein